MIQHTNHKTLRGKGRAARGGAPRPLPRGSRDAAGRGRPQRPGIDISRFINTAAARPPVESFTPEHRFEDFAIDPRIKRNIATKGYVTPTPIQDRAIVPVLEGRDIVGIADTGTGKTGAFLIPLLNKVIKRRGERVLIIVPTRELAQQIDEEFKAFARGIGFFSVCAVGGTNINPQLRGMRNRPHFVIGTPGRLKDLIDHAALDLSQFETVVLDEADRMLDMGFVRDIRLFLSKMPAQRQTLFFSATLSRDIEAMIGDFLTEPVRVSVKTGDTATSVHQDVVRIGGRVKLDVLCELLERPGFGKVIVFGRTKHGVERLAKLLKRRGFSADAIHGNKRQGQRQRALASFKEGRLQVLVATDVAARGIDVNEVSHVINYDIPSTYEDYVHRIGRTGRAGKQGRALTFVE